MKFQGEVIEAVTHGDAVRVALQCERGAEWRPMARIEFDVRPDEAKRFPVGRRVCVTVKPKP
jgi:hypothetical protein